METLSYSNDRRGNLFLIRYVDGTRVTNTYEGVSNRTKMQDSAGISTSRTYAAVTGIGFDQHGNVDKSVG